MPGTGVVLPVPDDCEFAPLGEPEPRTYKPRPEDEHLPEWGRCGRCGAMAKDHDPWPRCPAGDSDSFAVLAAELAVEGSPLADADLPRVAAAHLAQHPEHWGESRRDALLHALQEVRSR